jgi:hypothetical protein
MDPVDPVGAVTIKICYSPYDPREVQTLLQDVQKDFGKNRGRYYWKWLRPDLTQLVSNQDDNWVMAFYFQDPHDAIIFGLKYSR